MGLIVSGSLYDSATLVQGPDSTTYTRPEQYTIAEEITGVRTGRESQCGSESGIRRVDVWIPERLDRGKS